MAEMKAQNQALTQQLNDMEEWRRQMQQDKLKEKEARKAGGAFTFTTKPSPNTDNRPLSEQYEPESRVMMILTEGSSTYHPDFEITME